MIRVMIAAPASNSGKTVVTCALLRALRARGLDPCAFKCGPDYIDPMFHRAVLGVESHNLDLFFTEEARLRALFAAWCAGHRAAVCEGAMGFYDGLGGTTDRASAYHVSKTLDLPVILVLRAKGAGLSLAAQIRGLRDFRPDSHIAGVILNECSPMLCRTLAPALERETGVAVLGCLPPMEAAQIPARHLGLLTAGEIADLEQRLSVLAQALEENVDLPRLLALCERTQEKPAGEEPEPPRVRIAAAQDEAFCFTYAETLETLRRFGAEIAPFSPLRDPALPEGVDALYLPGGYPELYARPLSENKAMRRSIAAAVRGGMPTVAECGGFLYLGRALQDPAGESFPMAGVLDGVGENTGKLVRFGYGTLHAQEDSLLFRAGEDIPAHEFHHWDSTDCGAALTMEKPVSHRAWRCGFTSPTLYAGFPHLYFAGKPELAARLVAAAENYQTLRGI